MKKILFLSLGLAALAAPSMALADKTCDKAYAVGADRVFLCFKKVECPKSVKIQRRGCYAAKEWKNIEGKTSVADMNVYVFSDEEFYKDIVDENGKKVLKKGDGGRMVKTTLEHRRETFEPVDKKKSKFVFERPAIPLKAPRPGMKSFVKHDGIEEDFFVIDPKSLGKDIRDTQREVKEKAAGQPGAGSRDSSDEDGSGKSLE